MQDAEKKEKTALCLNCQQVLPAKDVIFCPSCGQKNSDGKVGMRDLLSRFFQHFTHLDNKIVYTFKDLLVPGKMTQQYFRGKRKRYPHPAQLFFVVMFFFLIAANFYSQDSIQVGPAAQRSDRKNLTKELFQNFQFQARSLQLRQLVDSLPDSLRDMHVRRAIDTLLLLSHDSVLRAFQADALKSIEDRSMVKDSSFSFPQQELWRQWPAWDSASIFFGNAKFRISLPDMAWMQEEDLLDKYQVQGYYSRLALKQSLRVFHDPVGLVKSYFGSFSVTILVLISFISGLLYYLYRRQKRYYVEHFVFLLHWHSGILLLFTLILFVGRWQADNISFYMLGLFLWSIISLFWGMRRYYGGTFRETAWRWLVFMSLYTVFFALVFMAGLVVALLLY